MTGAERRAHRRRQWEALKAQIGQGRIVPEKRRSFTPKERKFIYDRAEGKCEACGMRVGKAWDGDHIRQIYRGGEHKPHNWQLLCTGPGSCHAAKTAREATENAKCRRIEDREVNGPRESVRPILVRKDPWPEKSRPFPKRATR